MTGAAFTTFVVNTPATWAGVLLYNKDKSLRFFLIPIWSPIA